MNHLPRIDVDTPLVLGPIRPVCGGATPMSVLKDTNPELYKRAMDNLAKAFSDKLSDLQRESCKR